MSTIINARVICDGTVPDESSPTGRRGCPAAVEGGEQPDGSWVFPRDQAAARRLARAKGWLYVRYPGSRRSALSDDFCPDHEDQAQEQADIWGVKLSRPKAKPQGGPTP